MGKWVALICSCVLTTSAIAEMPAPLVLLGGDAATPLAAYAGAELQGYCGRLFVNPVTTTETESCAGRIIYGTPSGNAHIAAALGNGILSPPSGPLADQGYTLKTSGQDIYVSGSTDLGVLYGVYALLEAYGAYFLISGERLPAPAPFVPPPLDVTAVPAFRYRGLLPWDNFLCGMSGYNLEDYCQLIDRAVRMKLNLLQFHFYPGMAFFTETVDGRRVPAQYIGLPVDAHPTQGLIGESAFGGETIFGPRSYVEHTGNPAAQADAVQEMMRAVLDHARVRGMITCVGYELMSPAGGPFYYTDKPDGGANCIDPLRPENLQWSLERYRSLMATYPQSDYYWLWQSEARGVLGSPVGREPGAAEMRAACATWAGMPELAGDIDYAYHFRDIAMQLAPEERQRLATGGWSIQHLFPGIHLHLPPEIAFASLNPYDPMDTLARHMEFYRVGQEGRQAWMIDWWEFDGEQWFPQFRAGCQEQMYRKALEYGVQAVSLLGWKLSAVEHNIRYLADFAWDPSLAAGAFYDRYVQQVYGTDATPLADTYRAYDAMAAKMPPANPFDDRRMLLGAGWMPLGIPDYPNTPEECASPAWQALVQRAEAIAQEQQELLTQDRGAVALIGRLIPDLDAQGQSWAALMMNRLRFRALYLESMIALNTSYVTLHRQAASSDFIAAMSAAAAHVGQAVTLAAEAVALYAQDVRNRSDLGVIVQLNEQYYQPLRRFHASLAGHASPYVRVDETAFRLLPGIITDMAAESPWLPRDGTVSLEKGEHEGAPTLRMRLGGDGQRFRSVFMHSGPLALDDAPFMDITLKAEGGPVAIMFQVDGRDTWYALNLLGRQSLFAHLDGLPPGTLADGAYHRMVWDLRRLVREQVIADAQVIHNVILGAWDDPEAVIELEVLSCAFGQQRTLD